MVPANVAGAAAIRARTLVVGVALGLFMTGCQAASTPSATRTAQARTVAPQTISPSLVAAQQVHSKAAATALADEALDQVTFPSGSTRLPTRPVQGTADLNQLLTITSRVSRTRWWSVPGTVADVAAWLVAHPPHGLTFSLQNGAYSWSAAKPIAFDMEADLAQVGSDVDVSIGAQVTWTPAKTAIEAIPPSVTSASLDYTGATFGTDRRLVVSGVPLAQLRKGVNALATDWIGGRLCPADTGETASLTMRYEGHIVVISLGITGCAEVDVTSDGQPQPALDGYGYDNGHSDLGIMAIVKKLTQAPVKGPVPPQFRGEIFSAKAADARVHALLSGLVLPGPVTSQPVPDGQIALYEDRNNDFLTRSRWLHVPISRAALLTNLETHVPKGSTIAHIGVDPGGDTEVVEQLAGAYPSPVGLTVTLGPNGDVQVAATALWSPSRTPQETIPTSIRSALLTIEPYAQGTGLPTRRVDYRGSGLASLITWLNSRPAKLYTQPCGGPQAKLGATFQVGKRVVTFYWEDSCTIVVVVNGKAAPYLAGPATAIVEKLLHVRPRV